MKKIFLFLLILGFGLFLCQSVKAVQINLCEGVCYNTISEVISKYGNDYKSYEGTSIRRCESFLAMEDCNKALVERGTKGCYCKVNGGEKENVGIYTKKECEDNNSVSVALSVTPFTECEWNASSVSGEDSLDLDKIETPKSGIPLPEGVANLNRFGDRSIPDIIGGVIKAGTGIIGSIFLLMLVYGGVMVMIARGNAEQMKKGTNILVWSSLGIVVILASYAIVNFIFGVF